MNEDVRASKDVERRFRKPKHTKEHIKKNSNRYIVELKPNLSSKLLGERNS